MAMNQNLEAKVWERKVNNLVYLLFPIFFFSSHKYLQFFVLFFLFYPYPFNRSCFVYI